MSLLLRKFLLNLSQFFITKKKKEMLNNRPRPFYSQEKIMVCIIVYIFYLVFLYIFLYTSV